MAEFKTVTVFGASSRQGLAQIRQLKKQGYWVRGITRNRDIENPDLDNVAIMAADFMDVPSLVAACEGADAVFFTPPAFEGVMNKAQFVVNVGNAARQAGVKRLVFNPCAWAPDEPCGQSSYDGLLALEKALFACGVPTVVFRAVLFMDNLLTKWARPDIVEKGLYTYPHKPGLELSFISLDDVGRFMIEALKRDDLVGESIVIGGPEVITPESLIAMLEAKLGKKITYQPMSPRDFGIVMSEIWEDAAGIPKEAYAASMEDFYTFNNHSNHKPFLVDMKPVLERIPLKLTTMREWIDQQDWYEDQSGKVGSVSG